MAMAVALLIIFLTAPTVYGVDHIVGGNSGWTFGVDYSTWAAGPTFQVGDNLVFNYGSTHSVDEVSKAAYDSCSSSNPISHHSDGPTKIPLTTAGTKYFLCPATGHCAAGMKLTVVVAASGGNTPTTPLTPASSTPASPSPTGSTSLPIFPPPPDSGAEGGIGSISNVLLGSAAVLATILGFM